MKAIKIREMSTNDGRYMMMKSGPAVNADDVELAHVAALEVSVSWGDNVLHVEHLTPPRAFTLGTDATADGGAGGCDYVLGEGQLGASRRPLVIVGDDGPQVIVPAGAACEIAEVGAMSRSLEALVTSGEARPSGAVAGAYEVPLPAGRHVTFRLAQSELTFRVAAVCAGRKPVVDGAVPFFASSDAVKFVAASFLAHAGLLGALAYFLPGLGATDAEASDASNMALVQKLLAASAERELEQQPSAGAGGDEAPMKGDEGQRAEGTEGKMGDTSAKPVPARYALKRTSSSNEIELARDQAIREMNSDTILSMLLSDPARDRTLAAVWGDRPNGRDDRNAIGNNMFSTTLDDAFGAGGLRLDGNGSGGGGQGQGIAIDGLRGLGPGGEPWGGPTGTCGHPDCSGEGGKEGFGRGHGPLLGGHQPHQVKPAREPVVFFGGRLDPNVIQRIVRQNFGRFRMCYERGLTGNPGLQGRISTKFVIARDGSVATSQEGDSDMPDHAVTSCVVRSFQNLSFPAPEGGVVQVTYPLVFTPDE